MGISYLPLLFGVSPKHGVLEQKSLQFITEETNAKCFILLNAQIEADLGSTLFMTIVIYFPMDTF